MPYIDQAMAPKRISSQATHHLSEIIKVRRYPIPWAWMLISGLSATTPLLVGSLRGEIGLSIFGALTGYLIGLCDHQGPFRHRLAMATLSLFTCWSGFVLGIYAQNSSTGLVVSSILITFFIGLFGGKGAEVERALVFCGIDFFVSRYALTLHPSMIPQLSIYFLVAYSTAVFGISLSRLFLRQAPQPFKTIRESMRELAQFKGERVFYCATYCFAMLLGIFFVEHDHIVRGYWVLVTILLMMKPDRKETIYRLFQRLIGTLLGVLLGDLTIHLQPPIPVLELGVFTFAALVPFVWQRTYWLVAFCATNLVICLLSIAQYGHIETSLTFTRVKVTIVGCAISLFVIALAVMIETMWKALFNERTS